MMDHEGKVSPIDFGQSTIYGKETYRQLCIEGDTSDFPLLSHKYVDQFIFQADLVGFSQVTKFKRYIAKLKRHNKADALDTEMFIETVTRDLTDLISNDPTLKAFLELDQSLTCIDALKSTRKYEFMLLWESRGGSIKESSRDSIGDINLLAEDIAAGGSPVSNRKEDIKRFLAAFNAKTSSK